MDDVYCMRARVGLWLAKEQAPGSCFTRARGGDPGDRRPGVFARLLRRGRQTGRARLCNNKPLLSEKRRSTRSPAY